MNSALPSHPRVLVVGSGAREHAILWKLSQSRHSPTLYAAPGNAGMSDLAVCVDIAAGDVSNLVAFAEQQSIHLVVVGPEVPLSLGLADACIERGIAVFGPVQQAAAVETSKAFAKRLMDEANIPTAQYRNFADAEQAKAYVKDKGAPIVVKADGLAAGKGVVVAATVEEACAAIDDMLLGNRFGASGRTVVIEQFLVGSEVSMMFFVDDSGVVPMVPARDYKRVGEGDTGPNTGGMGAFAPVPDFAETGLVEVVQQRIVQPVLSQLRQQGIVYRGVLYAGLMMTDDGPYVIEFNCRFGDPETEVVLPLLESDLLEVLWAVAHDALAAVEVRWANAKAVCVVAAAPGYPEHPDVGQEISLPAAGTLSDTEVAEFSSGVGLFHAGTKRVDGRLVTAGGRVLVAYGVAPSFAEARSKAYHRLSRTQFDGMFVRPDIASHL